MGGGRNAPISPAVTADGGKAGLVVEELDAGLDPLSRGGGGAWLGEFEENAGLVELEGVGGGESDGCGDELGERLAGVRLVRGLNWVQVDVSN